MRIEDIPPSGRLVMLFKFSLIAICAFTALEVAHLAFLGSWSSEVFAAITEPVGTVTGIIIGAKNLEGVSILG